MGSVIQNCPCGRNEIFKNCCGKIHNSIELATTAEDLMRSRYTAFTMGNGAYLQKSHHSLTRPSKNESKEIESWAKSVSWVKLEVLKSSNGSLNDSSGTVEFKAYFLENSKLEVIHENSYFEMENGLWMYKNAF